MSANIHVWVLSGDRQENAVSTARSTGLIQKDTPILLIPELLEKKECREVLLEIVAGFKAEKKIKKSDNDLVLGKTNVLCSHAGLFNFKIKSSGRLEVS